MKPQKDRAENVRLKIRDIIFKECDCIRTLDNPRSVIEDYYKYIRWTDPELAKYIKKLMLSIFNFND